MGSVTISSKKPVSILINIKNGSEKVIYLDQKGWINLAKIQYGNPTESERELLKKILDVSNDGTAIFPISMANLMETNKIKSPQRRKQLSSIMASISKSNTLSPYWSHILELEVENLVRKSIGLPLFNIRKFLLGHGIPHLMGMKYSLTNEDKFDTENIKQIKKDFDEVLNDPKNLELILADEFHNPELETENMKVLETFENIREYFQNIKDNNMRYLVFLVHNFRATIYPRLAQALIKYNLPKEHVDKVIPQHDLRKILPSLPTALCEFTLLFRRDQLLQRPIEANDVPDLWHLQLAIPYCDIVVTEKMWTSICKQAKLDKICNTIILQSINELSEYLSYI